MSLKPDIQAELKAAVTIIMDTATYLISGSRNPTPRITPPGITSPAERGKERDIILAIYSHHGHGHVPQLRPGTQPPGSPLLVPRVLERGRGEGERGGGEGERGGRERGRGGGREKGGGERGGIIMIYSYHGEGHVLELGVQEPNPLDQHSGHHESSRQTKEKNPKNHQTNEEEEEEEEGKTDENCLRSFGAYRSWKRREVPCVKIGHDDERVTSRFQY